MEILDTITTFIITTSIVPLVLFTYVYDKGARLFKPRQYPWFKGPWRYNRQGRTIMSQKIALIVLVSVIAIMRIAGDFPGSEVLRLTAYIMVTTVFWAMLWMLQSTYKNEETYDEINKGQGEE